MVTMIMIVAYIWNFFSIRYYLVHILAKYWAFISYIKRISTLQTLDTLKINAHFTKSSAIF